MAVESRVKEKWLREVSVTELSAVRAEAKRRLVYFESVKFKAVSLKQNTQTIFLSLSDYSYFFNFS